MNRLHTICMDVTDEGSVQLGSDEVRQWLLETKTRIPSLRLFAVSHIAGAMLGGPVLWTPVTTFRKEMDVNYFGVLHVAKAFVPLLLSSASTASLSIPSPAPRFVVVTSMIGLMPSFPTLAGYACSKHAAEALCNNLRGELQPFGISVHQVNPGITKTPFLDAATAQHQRAWDAAPLWVREAYGEEYKTWLTQTVQFGVNYLAQSPADSVFSIIHALTGCWPKRRYYAGSESRLLGRFAVHAPDFLWDFGVRKAMGAIYQEPTLALRSKL